jgi:S1-C subfamily serine protease
MPKKEYAKKPSNAGKIISAILGGLGGAILAILVMLALLAYYKPLQPETQQQSEAQKPAEEQQTQPAPKTNVEGIIQQDYVIETVKNSQPAVVSIIITKDVPVLERYYEDTYDPFFQFRIPQYRERGTEEKEVGGGSGFIVDPEGYIVTNKHVVSEDDVEYTVFLNDGTEYEAEVVARDQLDDIAIIKINTEDDLPYLSLGNSDEIQIGQTVIAIGNPLLEFTNSVSVGVISGLGRSIVAGTYFGGPVEQLEDVIQTDAAINPGNSGGPLLNINGEVIGMNVAVATAENIGFALPSNMVKRIVDSVKEHGKIVRPYLGVRYAPINEAIQEANNLPVDYGVIVLRGETKEHLAVIPGSPADKAGLEENDIILEIDGMKLEKEKSLARIIAEKEVGDTVTLKILHDGEEKEVDVELQEIPE